MHLSRFSAYLLQDELPQAGNARAWDLYIRRLINSITFLSSLCVLCASAVMPPARSANVKT
ncbi:MAG: hypothetical protein V7K38_17205 [Nostoc sp.]|uniref:hypothetical protein n=1 Tax=Nostoc sp. TaxID=1180 RepID=UPI002FF7C483